MIYEKSTRFSVSAVHESPRKSGLLPQTTAATTRRFSSTANLRENINANLTHRKHAIVKEFGGNLGQLHEFYRIEISNFMNSGVS